VASGAAGGVARRLADVAVELDDPFAQARVRCEDAVVAVAVDTGWRDESAQCGEKLEGERASTVRPLWVRRAGW
jgi:hypothetical protein